MSRIESGRMVIKNEEFSFAKCLEQVNTIISGQCRDRGLHYDCRTKDRIDEYYIGDAMKLKQVLINILGNAVKFTPEGGSVNFDIEEVARFDGNATVRFIIRDTGIGMSKEYLPHIFDAFSQEDSSSTSQYGSTGLGMPEMDGVETTRQIRSVAGNDTPIIILTSFNWDDIADEARAAGVDTFVPKPLFAESVLDEFREAFKRKNEDLVTDRTDLTGRHILLAEDVAVNAEIIVMVLSMPVIALTANAFDEDVQRSMQAGLNAHLSKPVEPDDLFRTLETLIR